MNDDEDDISTGLFSLCRRGDIISVPGLLSLQGDVDW